MQAQGRARVLVRLGSRESDFAEHMEVNAPPAPKLCRTGCDPSRIPLLFGENSLQLFISIHFVFKNRLLNGSQSAAADLRAF
jgi:hypothetical protein